MFLISNICYALSGVLFSPQPQDNFFSKKKKISANVIQFKAFNVNSTGQATFPTSVLVSLPDKAESMMNVVQAEGFLFGANCKGNSLHDLQSVSSKHRMRPIPFPPPSACAERCYLDKPIFNRWGELFAVLLQCRQSFPSNCDYWLSPLVTAPLLSAKTVS